ncbi:bifunctional PTS fructose transporter subunit IIA/HPr protein [Enterovibrio norvegicus FF-33]|uniref:fused PTS fructose transporter subunit IIA/HPr protein n=1 Tax=Enterovibrio norvegicus TaxID=188144 RepID=UPI00031A0185|nr:fused PTS fructose transporter subunit IIA/HPr protein [Enterovibrio norvegicus]OEE68344.1 bifunctional PTS fructose transporter subunit IIA/HPr protein [Enterovibrio norvegicus FF-33]
MLELTPSDILLGKQANNKQKAISNIAKDLVNKGLVAEGYDVGMLAREAQNSTFLGNGIAIPHGTTDTRDLVKETGVQLHHFAEGVDWGDGNTVYLAIGIAAKSDEHLGILKQLTHVLSADGVEDALKSAVLADDVLAILNGEGQKGLLFDDSVVTVDFPGSDLISLLAVTAGKLKNANAVNEDYIADLLVKPATYLGQGLWLASSENGVNRPALSFISVHMPFDVESKPVKGLIAIAASGAAHVEILNNLSALLFNGKTNDLFASTAEDVIKALTEVRQAGISHTFKIKNAHGLHARPGAMLVSVAKKFDSQIWVANVSSESKQVNAKSLMKVIALGVKHGHELEFTADGVDALQAIDAIGEAIANGLGEG